MKTHPSARITVVFVVSLGLVLAAALAHAGDRTSSVTISTDDDGSQLKVAVSKGLLATMVEELVGSELSCDGGSDGEFTDLLRQLDRKGRGARATVETDDHTVITAKRKRKTVKIDIRDPDDDGAVEVVMPWLVAECLLGRDVVLDTSMAKIKVKVEGADGGRFEFKVD